MMTGSATVEFIDTGNEGLKVLSPDDFCGESKAALTLVEQLGIVYCAHLQGDFLYCYQWKSALAVVDLDFMKLHYFNSFEYSIWDVEDDAFKRIDDELVFFSDAGVLYVGARTCRWILFNKLLRYKTEIDFKDISIGMINVRWGNNEITPYGIKYLDDLIGEDIPKVTTKMMNVTGIQKILRPPSELT